MITLSTPAGGELVSLQTQVQKNFKNDEIARRSVDGELNFKWDALIARGNDRSIPNPVAFSWEPTDKPAILYISKKSGMENARAYNIPADTKRYEIYNLDIGTEYFWYVEIAGDKSAVSSFRTLCETPRGIFAEGLTNIRDMGGYETISGKRIRRNMVFRGSEFDSHVSVTDNGVKALREDLKLKSDLDMRGEAVGVLKEGPLSKHGICWKLIPLTPYETIFNGESKENYRRFFDVFIDINNYPIYFHCWGGADRTGTFAFLLGALLGMTIDDLIIEYEWTSLSIWGIRTRNYAKFQDFINGLNKYGGEGDSIHIKAENYFLSAGVTAESINTVREIMLEK